MSTYRERQEARAERLRGWAAGREAKAAAAFGTAERMAEVIPFGQPVHGAADRRYRDRIGANMARGLESSRMAARHAERAGNIEAAAERAIYSDDPDARERLRERLAELEAERDRIKAFNASCRKGAPDLGLLTEAERARYADVARVQAYALGKRGEYPAYHLANLGGNIARQRKRLEYLERAAERPESIPGRWLEARYVGACETCGEAIERGDRALYVKATRALYCAPCGEARRGGNGGEA